MSAVASPVQIPGTEMHPAADRKCVFGLHPVVRSKPIILTAHNCVLSTLLRRPWVGICYRTDVYNGRKIVMLCYYWGQRDVNKS